MTKLKNLQYPSEQITIEENEIENYIVNKYGNDWANSLYNKNGEDNYWYQPFVRSAFADDELLIGKDYWNLVCNDINGFDVVMEQYRISAAKIQNAIDKIKDLYFADK